MMNTELIMTLIGLVAGSFLAWLLTHRYYAARLKFSDEMQAQSQSKLQQLENTLQQAKEEKDKFFGEAQLLRGQLQQMQEELMHYRKLQDDLTAVQNERAALEEQLKQAKEKMANAEKEMEENFRRMEQEFKLLAQKIFEEKSQKFTEINEKNIKDVLQPVKEELERFKKKVEETYDRESKERFTLGREITRLIETTQKVSQEANNLTTALKGNKKLQGNWGELLLESILEHSGLTRNREYFLQEYIRDAAGQLIKDENGHALQPDAIILYPDERKVIVDSKVSLLAWERYVNAATAEEQQEAMKEHLHSLRQHITNLSRKNYPRYAKALDQVIMFVPIEAAYLEAMKEDNQLWKDAYGQNILLTSPTNLLAVLKIVADLWRIEKQSRHAMDIAEKAGALYDKFVGFVESLQEIGVKLRQAQNSYDEAFNKLRSGNGNLVRRVEELKKMGAAAKKQLPGTLLNEATDL